MVKQRAGFKPRKSNLKSRLLPFSPLLDFVNQEITGENWPGQLFKIMGEEKSCHVTYQTAEKQKREKMLESDICSNLQVELFGTAVVFDPRQSMERIAGSIIAIEDCVPLIGGKEGSPDSARQLQNELKAMLYEIAGAGLAEPAEQMRLRKKIAQAFGARPLSRDAILFPDGDVFFKSWLYDRDDCRTLAFFQLARLFDELCRPRSCVDFNVVAPTCGRKLNFKIFNEVLTEKVHGPAASSAYGGPLKLSVCACGCDQLFLQSGLHLKSFLDDRHRMGYHNSARTRSGANAEAVRKFRKKAKS